MNYSTEEMGTRSACLAGAHHGKKALMFAQHMLWFREDGMVATAAPGVPSAAAERKIRRKRLARISSRPSLACRKFSRRQHPGAWIVIDRSGRPPTNKPEARRERAFINATPSLRRRANHLRPSARKRSTEPEPCR